MCHGFTLCAGRNAPRLLSPAGVWALTPRNRCFLWNQHMNINCGHTQASEPTNQGVVVVDQAGAPELYRLLAEAAEIAAKAGIAPEAFAASAWQAYLAASPGLAEHLAEMQFDAALEHLRESGRLAKA
jgi:hypothetical protein